MFIAGKANFIFAVLFFLIEIPRAIEIDSIPNFHKIHIQLPKPIRFMDQACPKVPKSELRMLESLCGEHLIDLMGKKYSNEYLRPVKRKTAQNYFLYSKGIMRDFPNFASLLTTLNDADLPLIQIKNCSAIAIGILLANDIPIVVDTENYYRGDSCHTSFSMVDVIYGYSWIEKEPQASPIGEMLLTFWSGVEAKYAFNQFIEGEVTIRKNDVRKIRAAFLVTSVAPKLLSKYLQEQLWYYGGGYGRLPDLIPMDTLRIGL